MNNLQDKVKSLIIDGKADEEIAEAILSEEPSSAYSVKDISAAIIKAKKLEDVSSALREAKQKELEIEAKAMEKEALNEKIDQAVSEKLKSINIDPFKTYSTKFKSEWDWGTKDFIEREPSEGHKSFNNLIIAIGRKDFSSANAISSEIESDNAIHGVKATLRSDSNSVGAYAIPTEVQGKVHQMSYQLSAMLKMANTDFVVFESKIYPTVGNVSVSYIANQDTALTESNPTFYNPTIAMKRVGAFTRVSNTIIRQKGADLTNAVISGLASARARFIDKHTCIGNITGASDLQDGLVWLGVQESSPVAKSAITLQTLVDMTVNINQEVNWDSLAWVMNPNIYSTVGLLEDTGGSKAFPTFLTGGAFNPLGYPVIRNSQITNVLQVGEDNSTGGTDSVIMLVDMSKFVIGIDKEMRLDVSTEESFTKDLTTFRSIERMGWNVLFDNTSASGGICRVQEVTGA